MNGWRLNVLEYGASDVPFVAWSEESAESAEYDVLEDWCWNDGSVQIRVAKFDDLTEFC